MLKRLFLISLLLLLVNCVSAGKIGYLVPAEKDTKPLPQNVVGQYCGTILIGITDNLNAQLKNQNNATNKDVAVIYDQGFASACLQIRK